MERFVRFAGFAVLAVVLAIGGYWIIQQAYRDQPTTDLRPLATQACARPVGPAQRTDCVQLAAAISADDSADLSRLALLLSLASTAVAAFGTFVVVLSLRHSRRAIEAASEANRIASEATEAQQRAWLSVRAERIVLSSVDGNLRVRGAACLHNHGQTPARDVSYYPMLAFSDPAKEAAETIAQFQSGSIDWSQGTIFPNGDETYAFDSTAEDSPDTDGPVFLIIVVAYRTAFTERMRFSALGWRIFNGANRDGHIHPAAPPSKSHIVLVGLDNFPGIVT